MSTDPSAIKTFYRNTVLQSVQCRIGDPRQRGRHLRARNHTRFQQSLDQLAALRHAYAGEACTIVGNGPSMRDFDLSQLAGLRSFCLNRGYRRAKSAFEKAGGQIINATPGTLLDVFEKAEPKDALRALG